jgi:hypothetical protein
MDEATQETRTTDEVIICIVCKESGVEIRYADEDEAVAERAAQILTYLTLPLASLKAALRVAYKETAQ